MLASGLLKLRVHDEDERSPVYLLLTSYYYHEAQYDAFKDSLNSNDQLKAYNYLLSLKCPPIEMKSINDEEEQIKKLEEMKDFIMSIHEKKA